MLEFKLLREYYQKRIFQNHFNLLRRNPIRLQMKKRLFSLMNQLYKEIITKLFTFVLVKIPKLTINIKKFQRIKFRNLYGQIFIKVRSLN